MADNDVTRIAGNIGAMNTLYALNNINKELSTHSTRLSTGKRINSAEDDPAGLAISTKMEARSEGMKVALDNIGDAKNLLAVAESGLGSLNDIMIQMRNKAEAAASDTMGTSEREIIKTQLLSYADQIDDIVEQTKWNGNNLIDGSYATGVGSLTFQTGSDEGETTTLTGLANVSSVALGLVTSLASSTVTGTFDTVGTGSGVYASTAGNAVFSTSGAGMTEIETGDYTVKVNIGTSGSASSTVQLYDTSGNLVNVDADGVAGGSLDNKVTFTYTNGAASTVDFGNGLRVTVGAASVTLAAGSHSSQEVTYTKAGTDQINASTAADYSAYMTTINTAIDTVNTQLSKIGSLTGSLSFKEDQVSAAQINVEASYNRIMNADMAEEQVNYSKLAILQQTSTSMLAQANAAPQFLLTLFQ
jgi:flagellin